MLIKVINGFIFVIIITITYIGLKYINNLMSKKVTDAQNKIEKNSKKIVKEIEKLVKNKVYSSKFDRTQERLNKLGNPFNLNVATYYIIKVTTSILAFLISVFSKNNILITIFAPIFIYFFIDMSYYFRNKNDNSEILYDLPDLCDVLNIQTSAGVQLGLALTEIYELPKNERLKKNLMELSAEIELTKNPSKALDKFIGKFNLPEINNFAIAIKQALKTGRVKEILDNQSEMLKENNLQNIQTETKKITVFIGTLSAFIFLGVVAFMFYGFSTQFKENLFKIFN